MAAFATGSARRLASVAFFVGVLTLAAGAGRAATPCQRDGECLVGSSCVSGLCQPRATGTTEPTEPEVGAPVPDPPPATTSEKPELPKDVSATAEPSPAYESILGWVGTGLGGILLITAAGLWAEYEDMREDVLCTSPPPECPTYQQRVEMSDDAKSMRLASEISVAVGATLVVGGIIAFSLHAAGVHPEVDAAVAPTKGGASFTMGARF